MINKDLRNFLFLYFSCSILLVGTGLVVPYWYDDVCHSLVVYQLYMNGVWGYPLEYPQILHYDPHSTIISVGPVLHYLATGFCKIFGWSFEHLRIFISIINAFLPCATYHFAKTFFNPKSAFFSAILLIINLQFLVYGSQYLGEVFLFHLLFWGIYFQLIALKNSQNTYFIVSQIFFYAAILTKEYIALPLGLYLFFAWLFYTYKTKKFFNPLFIQGIMLPLISFFYYFYHFDNLQDFLSYWEIKRDYQAEFLSWSLQPLYFVLKKPLILFGSTLILLKIFIKKNEHDIFIGIFQLVLLFFFLLSKGFDRFGFLLIPLSCLYCAEWLPFFWNFITKKSYQLIFFMFLGLFIAQNTINPLYWFNQYQKKNQLIELARKIDNTGIEIFFTYELEIIPYLKRSQIQTTSIPPVSHLRIKNKIQEPFFLVGPYAQTEYQNTWNYQDYKIIWSFGDYQLLRFQEQK